MLCFWIFVFGCFVLFPFVIILPLPQTPHSSKRAEYISRLVGKEGASRSSTQAKLFGLPAPKFEDKTPSLAPPAVDNKSKTKSLPKASKTLPKGSTLPASKEHMFRQKCFVKGSCRSCQKPIKGFLRKVRQVCLCLCDLPDALNICNFTVGCRLLAMLCGGPPRVCGSDYGEL